ncbi:hypothetical protein LNQ49_14135 [Flavobacterium sp. F-65]|uniref:Reverse transcriptase domain-containing protein n=1 Tax=Flavobacterium pisciphilum TaxID=2893755 RepID=A0ABS8MXB3_9FLAO|nr:reverse transcriptase domain-containing protein [Flavobacterium sp. F-65]MCC9072722.1 hypothetical protein [Flavobacterium sp. F-65]
MAVKSLYTDELWKRYYDKVVDGKAEFAIKKYPQLDPFFDFQNQSDKIKDLVSDATLNSVANHPFLPFVKILTKTPRFRYQETEKQYALDTKIRPIAFASHFDTYIYGFYAFALNEKYQDYIKSKKFDDCILAYRTDLDGKCNIQFAKEVFNIVQDRIKNNKSCSAIAIDITGYFDNIDHSILKEKWHKILGTPILPIDQYKVFRSLTKYSYISKNSILKHFQIDLDKYSKHWQSLLDLIPNSINGSTFKEKFDLLRKRKLIVTNLPKKNKKDGRLENRGIPQGSAMSAVLSNIYLIDFDNWLKEQSINLDFTYRRYCDDIIIICNTIDAKDINQKLVEEIEKYKVTIQSKKTELIEFKVNSKGVIRGFNKSKIIKENATINSQNEQQYYKNLQYLGFEFNGQNIYIRPGSLSRYFRKMKGRIIKSIMMSYSDKSKKDKILKKQIFERYSHLGKRNFLSYAINSSKEFYSNSKGVKKEGMNSLSIKRQLTSHFSIMEQSINNKSFQRYEFKIVKRNAKIEAGKRVKEVIYKE